MAYLKHFEANSALEPIKTSCKADDVASANDLTAQLNAYTDITGTTQINRLSDVNANAGDDIFLQFDGALTVKHNQTAGGDFVEILLSGSVDLVTAAATRLWLKYNGTVFEEWGRTLA